MYDPDLSQIMIHFRNTLLYAKEVLSNLYVVTHTLNMYKISRTNYTSTRGSILKMD